MFLDRLSDSVQLCPQGSWLACAMHLDGGGVATGTYFNGIEGWLRFVGVRRLYSAQYVGGLNASGAPHGIGVWMDSYRHGEFLVGCASTRALLPHWLYRVTLYSLLGRR